jgi:methionine-rich copper-binding protein CopC
MRMLRLLVVLAGSVLLLLPGLAHAHAFLRHASPAVGSTLASAPPQLTLDFTEAVEPRFSGVEVRDPKGAQVDAGDLHVAPDNAKRLVLGLQPLQPGAYKVVWHITSVDTHRTEGTFVFTVQP